MLFQNIANFLTIKKFELNEDFVYHLNPEIIIYRIIDSYGSANSKRSISMIKPAVDRSGK